MFQTETVQRRVYKSLKLWSMYADLEESLGTFQVIIHVVAGLWGVSVFYPRDAQFACCMEACLLHVPFSCGGRLLYVLRSYLKSSSVDLKRKDLESLYVCDDQSKYRILNIRR